MSAAEMKAKSWTVADRFKFQPSEIDRLSLSELRDWYDGAVELYKLDKGDHA